MANTSQPTGAQPEPDIVASWLQFLIEPGTQPPCKVRLGLRTPMGDPITMLADVVIAGVAHIPDGIEKAETVLKRLGVAKTQDFALVYPLYAVDDPDLEMQSYELAWLVKEEADRRGWGFTRQIPQ
ncbi:MAG: hypothetical protein WCD37_00730 [Chloroflexia bacterium]